MDNQVVWVITMLLVAAVEAPPYTVLEQALAAMVLTAVLAVVALEQWLLGLAETEHQNKETTGLLVEPPLLLVAVAVLEALGQVLLVALEEVYLLLAHQLPTQQVATATLQQQQAPILAMVVVVPTQAVALVVLVVQE
jgi:hypothetical protein